jgi:hypothetical protein
MVIIRTWEVISEQFHTRTVPFRNCEYKEPMHVVAAHPRKTTCLRELTSQRPNLRFFQKKIECVSLNKPLPLPAKSFPKQIMRTHSTLGVGPFAFGRFRIQISAAFCLSRLRFYVVFLMRPVKCRDGASKLCDRKLAHPLFTNRPTIRV